MLNPTRVHLIRTSGLTDTHWARIWRVHTRTINEARRGLTWADHPTKPDTKPRGKGGSHPPQEAK
jgi:hypothetical protein